MHSRSPGAIPQGDYVIADNATASSTVSPGKAHAADGRNQAGKLSLPSRGGLSEHSAQMRLDRVRRKLEKLCGLANSVAGGGGERYPRLGLSEPVGIHDLPQRNRAPTSRASPTWVMLPRRLRNGADARRQVLRRGPRIGLAR